MQRAVTELHSPLFLLEDAQVATICRVSDGFRERGLPVLHGALVYPDGLIGAQPFVRRAGDAVLPLTVSSPLAALDPRLGRDTQGTIFRTAPSCFFRTHLDEFLAASGSDTVVLVGCSTSGCIRATAIDAASLGYRCIVVADAVFDRTSLAHRSALLDLQAKYAELSSEALLMPWLPSGKSVDHRPPAERIAQQVD